MFQKRIAQHFEAELGSNYPTEYYSKQLSDWLRRPGHRYDLTLQGNCNCEHRLKILIYSRAFRPSIGGLETMMEILAEEFTAAGHRVKVVTQVSGKAEDDHDYEVV